MKTSWILFLGLSLFYVIMAVIYWQVGGEPVGITAIGLSAGLSLIVGFYLWFTSKRLGNVLPEDNQLGEIADSAGEMGFFSPHSMVATTCCIICLRCWIGFDYRMVVGANSSW